MSKQLKTASIINEETGSWLVCERTDKLEICAAYGTRRGCGAKKAH